MRVLRLGKANTRGWRTLTSGQLQVMKEIINTSDHRAPGHASVGNSGTDPDEDFLLGGLSSVEAEESLPLPSQIFRLWQIFLERVNPLTKVVHTPTLQPFIVDAAASHETMPYNYQALVTTIYLAATVALNREEASSILNMDRDAAIARFTRGVKSALIKAKFMENYDMVIMQALILYSVGSLLLPIRLKPILTKFQTVLQGRHGRDATWFLNGIVMRIARKLGLHRDGESLQLGAFETEMRRRLWWQLLALDSAAAALSGVRETLLPSDWDCKMPSNVNDSDISPQSTVILAHDVPTEMVWQQTICTLGKFMFENGLINFDSDIMHAQSAEPGSPDYQSYLDSIKKYSTLIDDLDACMLSAERKYCNPAAGPIHACAASLRPHIVNKLRTVLTPMRNCPEWGTDVKSARDNLFRILLSHHEHDLDVYEDFRWFSRVHFRADSFLYMVGEMHARPQTGGFADRFWRLVEGVYERQEDLWDMRRGQNVQIAEFVVRAWRLRERSLHRIGMPYDVPTYIQRFQASLIQRGMGKSDLAGDQEEAVSALYPDPSAADLLLDPASAGLTDPVLNGDGSEGIHGLSMHDWENHTTGFSLDTFGNLGQPYDHGW